MKAKARIASAIALSIPIHTPVSTANAVTLGALCASDDMTRSVLRFSKRLRFPVEAGRLRPDHAYFIEEAGLMSCTYSLTAGNAYDFGKFKATFRSPQYGQLRVISLTPVD